MGRWYDFSTREYRVPNCCICCCGVDSLEKVYITQYEVVSVPFTGNVQYKKTMAFNFCRRCRNLRKRQFNSYLFTFAAISTYIFLQWITFQIQGDLIKFPFNLLIPFLITFLIFLTIFKNRLIIEQLGLKKEDIELLEIAKNPVSFNAMSDHYTRIDFANQEYEMIFYLLNR